MIIDSRLLHWSVYRDFNKLALVDLFAVLHCTIAIASVLYFIHILNVNNNRWPALMIL